MTTTNTMTPTMKQYQALEQRLREREEQVQRLTAQVKDRDSRLRQREQEVR